MNLKKAKDIVMPYKNYFLTHKFMLVLPLIVLLIMFILLATTGKKAHTKPVMEVATTQSTTTEATTEVTTVIEIHYNADGKLYGQKGKFSGLWKGLEAKAKASNEDYIKELMVFVGDNTELKKVVYTDDNFVKLNGYGTVHWSQSGHKWYNKYSSAFKGVLEKSEEELFESIKNEHKPLANIAKIMSKDSIETGNAVGITETTTAVTTTTESTTEVTTQELPQGKLWSTNACGVCSLAMALSTLSGVTVSPPEVAIAANLLIGEEAWYETILYSQSQAKLAQMAGFNVQIEPYNEAKKESMDKCLDANGVALFVTDKEPWTDGRHYIMVRNRVGDKYYTADSGKNPTQAFTYDELSAGYCQQYIVYIYPKTK